VLELADGVVEASENLIGPAEQVVAAGLELLERRELGPGQRVT
jgi:hypothetical protein